MRELSINYPKQPRDEEIIARYTKKYSQELEAIVEDDMKRYTYGDLDVDAAANQIPPFSLQLKTVLWRAKTFVTREPQAVFAKIGQGIFNGLLIMLLYWGVGDDISETGVQNTAGCNFFLLVGLLMGWMFGSVLTFQLERDVFMREQANKMYKPTVYVLAKNLVELPATLIAPMLTLLLAYWAVQYSNFLRIYLTMILLA